MALGPGKYDHIATAARQVTKARGVVVIVIGGEAGSGFSVQTTDPHLSRALPALLRELAEQIDADTR